ncbi:MAG: hypothetical protein RI993_1804 [Pseudomonadota bacterium]|jgi:hypothetical protein
MLLPVYDIMIAWRLRTDGCIVTVQRSHPRNHSFLELRELR